MQIEFGDFDLTDGQLLVHARARVVTEPADFERLELREFESGQRLSPCVRWCHEAVGPGYLLWELVSSANGDTFYFSRAQDARRFWALYGDPPCDGGEHVPLAA